MGSRCPQRGPRGEGCPQGLVGGLQDPAGGLASLRCTVTYGTFRVLPGALLGPWGLSLLPPPPLPLRRGNAKSHMLEEQPGAGRDVGTLTTLIRARRHRRLGGSELGSLGPKCSPPNTSPPPPVDTCPVRS